MKFTRFLLLVTLGIQCSPSTQHAVPLRFAISFSGVSDQPQSGRILLMLSRHEKPEPRFQINDGLAAQLVFGVDAVDLKPGEEIIVESANAFGFPIPSLRTSRRRVYPTSLDQPVRNVSPGHGSHGITSTRSGRRAAVEPQAR